MRYLKLNKNEKLICTEFVSLCAEENIKKTRQKTVKDSQKVQTAGYNGRSTTFGAVKFEEGWNIVFLSNHCTMV